MKLKNYIVSQYSFEQDETRLFSSGKYYMILYILKGTCHISINDNWHLCSIEDMLLLKPGQKTSLRSQNNRVPLELLQIKVHPAYLTELSDETTNLLSSFQFAPQNITIIRARRSLSMLIKNITLTLLNMPQDENEYGHNLYEKNLISIVLVLFIRSCIDADKVHRSHNRKNLLMDDLFLYIHAHLTEELTLERLEKEFFVSRYHICREFKKTTGQTLHSYIVKSRLDLCRKYIEQGKPIREVYALSGFGEYNHFFRAFKKEYHMTPGEYYKSLKLQE